METYGTEGNTALRPGEGLYTNMNSIRRDEELDNPPLLLLRRPVGLGGHHQRGAHHRNPLESTVQTIFKIIKPLEPEVWVQISTGCKASAGAHHLHHYPGAVDRYRTRLQRSVRTSSPKSTVVSSLMRIGDKLTTGEPHDDAHRTTMTGS